MRPLVGGVGWWLLILAGTGAIGLAGYWKTEADLANRAQKKCVEESGRYLEIRIKETECRNRGGNILLGPTHQCYRTEPVP